MPQTIALVDDDRNILTSVTITLEAEGFAVRTYSDGAEALRGLAAQPVDLAVLDIKMARMDGETEKAKRKDFISRLDHEYYNQYMNLLKRYGDKVVVEARNEICLGCNTNIPPQLYNDIKIGDVLYHCFFCKRFLFIKPSAESANHTEVSTVTS